MGLMFNPNSLYKFPRVLKKKKEKKTPWGFTVSNTYSNSDPAWVSALPGVIGSVRTTREEAIMPVSKKKTSLDTKNQEKPSHLKGCQRHQYLIYKAKVKRLSGRQNPRGN